MEKRSKEFTESTMETDGQLKITGLKFEKDRFYEFSSLILIEM